MAQGIEHDHYQQAHPHEVPWEMGRSITENLALLAQTRDGQDLSGGRGRNKNLCLRPVGLRTQQALSVHPHDHKR